LRIFVFAGHTTEKKKGRIFLKKIRKLTALALALALVACLSTGTSALSKRGSTGSEVRQIQTKLKNWGYYTGEIDGIYGAKTEEAVKWFQRKNSLAVDGIAGAKTLAAMGISSSGTASAGGLKQSDINLLARVIAAEARGESYTGQVAVGAVILNRVRHPSFPDTVSGVVYQRGAFTCMTDGQFSSISVPESCTKAARAAANGWDPSGGAIYYYNPAKTANAWIRSRPVVTTIGSHVFCK